MTEARIGLLYKMASCFKRSEYNESSTVLRSYYLMRCKEITGGFGLPDKHFSKKRICPRCCLKWTKDTKVNIKPTKLSTRQKQKIRSMKITNKNENYVKTRRTLLHSNLMDQICTFCKSTTETILLKPDREYNKEDKIIKPIPKSATSLNKPNHHSKELIKNKTEIKKTESLKKNTTTNVYSNAIDVFSLKNKQNTLASTVKEAPKVIKNNKKKKDKFAGLCQKAVLASAKMKTQEHAEKSAKDKLSLFLKPATG